MAGPGRAVPAAGTGAPPNGTPGYGIETGESGGENVETVHVRRQTCELLEKVGTKIRRAVIG